MNVKEELEKIEAFLDSMSMNEFDEMLARNGAGDKRYSKDIDYELYLSNIKDISMEDKLMQNDEYKCYSGYDLNSEAA